MKKFWQIVSKKDFIFIIIIFALVILFSFRPSNKIRVSFHEDAVDVQTTKYSMNIPYNIIDSIELTDKADPGEEIDGYNDNVIVTGLWKNDTWGEYTSCVEAATNICIVFHLDDGRTFVISRRDDAETSLVFQELQTQLDRFQTAS